MAEEISFGYTTSYQCERTFISNEGIAVSAVAGKIDRSEPCALIRTHSPIEQMVISWVAIRRGGPPVVPHPLSFENSPNVVFLSQTISAPIATPIGNGLGHEWQIAGVFVYALRVPRKVDDPIATGKMPFEEGAANQQTIPSSKFSKNMLGTDGVGSFNGAVFPQQGIAR